MREREGSVPGRKGRWGAACVREFLLTVLLHC